MRVSATQTAPLPLAGEGGTQSVEWREAYFGTTADRYSGELLRFGGPSPSRLLRNGPLPLPQAGEGLRLSPRWISVTGLRFSAALSVLRAAEAGTSRRAASSRLAPAGMAATASRMASCTAANELGLVLAVGEAVQADHGVALQIAAASVTKVATAMP